MFLYTSSLFYPIRNLSSIFGPKKNLSTHTVVQSICDHFFSLSGKPDSFYGMELKKCQLQNMDQKKAGCKNRFILIQKEKRPGCLFSFWIIMTLFLRPAFFRSIFKTWFFSGSQTDPWLKQEWWVQIDWAIQRSHLL